MSDGGHSGGAGRRSFEVRTRSEAPVADVWPLLGEARRWSEWSFLTGSRLEREGRPDPDGVGAVRRFTSFGIGSREEVVAWEPPHHLGYTILSGFPVRGYRADVVLRPDEAGGGTVITWSATFDERFPGTGRLTTLALRAVIRRLAGAAAAYADRLAEQARP